MKRVSIALPPVLVVVLGIAGFVHADDGPSLGKTQEFIVEKVKSISVYRQIGWSTPPEPTDWAEAGFKDGRLILTTYRRDSDRKKGAVETCVRVRSCDVADLTRANRFGLACIFIDTNKKAVAGVEHWVTAEGTKGPETPVAPGDSLWFFINDKAEADLLVKAINRLIELTPKRPDPPK